MEFLGQSKFRFAFVLSESLSKRTIVDDIPWSYLGRVGRVEGEPHGISSVTNSNGSDINVTDGNEIAAPHFKPSSAKVSG